MACYFGLLGRGFRLPGFGRLPGGLLSRPPLRSDGPFDSVFASSFFPNHFGNISAKVSGGLVIFSFGLFEAGADRCAAAPVPILLTVAMMSVAVDSGSSTLVPLGVNRLINARSTNDQVDDVIK